MFHIYYVYSEGFPVLRALMTEILQIGVGTSSGGSGVVPPSISQPKTTSTSLKHGRSSPGSPARKFREVRRCVHILVGRDPYII